MDIPVEERKKQITDHVENIFCRRRPTVLYYVRTASPPVFCLIGFDLLFFVDAIACGGAVCPKDDVWL